MPDTLAQKIANLEALLDSGAKTVIVDNMTISVDPSEVRRRLRDLYAQRDGQRTFRPIRFSGGYDSY